VGKVPFPAATHNNMTLVNLTLIIEHFVYVITRFGFYFRPFQFLPSDVIAYFLLLQSRKHKNLKSKRSLTLTRLFMLPIKYYA
jgi:hypothetical protein